MASNEFTEINVIIVVIKFKQKEVVAAVIGSDNDTDDITKSCRHTDHGSKF
jgi:hypothetical protein